MGEMPCRCRPGSTRRYRRTGRAAVSGGWRPVAAGFFRELLVLALVTPTLRKGRPNRQLALAGSLNQAAGKAAIAVARGPASPAATIITDSQLQYVPVQLYLASHGFLLSAPSQVTDRAGPCPATCKTWIVSRMLVVCARGNGKRDHPIVWFCFSVRTES